MPAGQGRWPDPERCRLVAELRGEGLAPAEIGRRLGVSRQAVHYCLKRSLPSANPGVTCRGCKAVAVPKGARVRERGEGFCPACLRRRGAPFRRVLRACRLAAGMNRAELGRRAGLRSLALGEYESGKVRPQRATVARLAAVLGRELMAAGD
jgi:DNA-binding XRE family transcriptional regulator